MAITVTKLSPSPRRFGPSEGCNEIEFSITFDTAYPATGGESLGFGTNTNFLKKVYYMLVTKEPVASSTNALSYVARFAKGTSDGATNAKVQLFKQVISAATGSYVKLEEASTTNSSQGIKMRAIFGGY